MCLLVVVSANCQESGMPSNCALFSPHQIQLEDYLKFNAYEKFAGMDVEVTRLRNNKNEVEVSFLVNLFSSDDIPERKPLNLCFALDRSASMEENHRMEKLKTAMKDILSVLTSDDYISIVVYDEQANVLLSSRRYNKAQDSVFRDIIDKITIGGGTNMMAGMLKGYNEISKNASKRYKNRLILMSDGVSNIGETDPVKILKHSTDYYKKGVETSTIGIGNNINFNLLHLIAVEGSGTSHFAGDCDSAYIDIGYVLRDELYSMNTNMENIRLEISYPKHFKLDDVFGASKFFDDTKKLFISSQNLYHQNQFILVKFKTKRDNKKDLITFNLNFTENGKDKNIVKQTSYVNNNAPSSKMLLTDKIITVIKCVKNRLVNHRQKLDCLDRFVEEPNVPDNIVLLKTLIGA
jgi:Mg-chelatase subunit ChlD